jgi:NitT/TauT family transport system substrate-binding protein
MTMRPLPNTPTRTSLASLPSDRKQTDMTLFTKRRAAALAVVPLVVAALAGCSTVSTSSPASTSTSAGSTKGLTTVKLQLQWFTQAQFAGYIAASAEGYYKKEGLNVEIINGGPDISSQNTVAQGNADFATAWVAPSLASREAGANVTDVAQIFQRGGLQEYSMKGEGITSAADLKGKKVGVNGSGNDVDVLAGLAKAGIKPSQVTLVQQQGSIKGLLTGDLDAAQGASYNELGTILSTINPKTGKEYTKSDLNIIDWNKNGTAMLEDGLWANSTRLASSASYRATTQKFVTASLQGWIFCRDNVTKCRNDVVEAGSNLGASLQLFQTNGVNQLIWPDTNGLGTIDKTSWDNTVSIAKSTLESDGKPMLKADPSSDAYTNTYVEKAQKTLTGQGLDVYGKNYKPISVKLKINGQ